MTDREAMKQALEVLEEIADEVFSPYDNKLGEVILALRDRLAQPEQPSVPWSAALEAVWGEPEQEPAAWADMDVRGEDKGLSWTPGHFHKAPLYTTPPQRKPLTNGEIYTAYITATNQTLRAQDERLALAFARAIEAAHGIKGEA